MEVLAEGWLLKKVFDWFRRFILMIGLTVYIYIYIYILYIYIYHSMFLHINKNISMFHSPFRDTLELWIFVPRNSFRTTDPWGFWSGAFRNLEKTSSTTQLGLGREWFSRCSFFGEKKPQTGGIKLDAIWMVILMDLATLCIVWVGNWYPSWN